MRQPKLGCGTQTLTSVHHHFLVHNVYIYIRPVLGISPVWKSTKTSQKPYSPFPFSLQTHCAGRTISVRLRLDSDAVSNKSIGHSNRRANHQVALEPYITDSVLCPFALA